MGLSVARSCLEGSLFTALPLPVVTAFHVSLVLSDLAANHLAVIISARHKTF